MSVLRKMVDTSLKMPATDSVTTEVRWIKANSEVVMANANVPGKQIRQAVRMVALKDPQNLSSEKTANGPSMARLQIASVRAMMGASQKSCTGQATISTVKESGRTNDNTQ